MSNEPILSYCIKANRLDDLVFSFAMKSLNAKNKTDADRYTRAWIRAYYLRDYMRLRGFGRTHQFAIIKWLLYLDVCANVRTIADAMLRF